MGPWMPALSIKLDFALNRPVEDWGKLLGDVAAVSAMLDRLFHHGHVLKFRIFAPGQTSRRLPRAPRENRGPQPAAQGI